MSKERTWLASIEETATKDSGAMLEYLSILEAIDRFGMSKLEVEDSEETPLVMGVSCRFVDIIVVRWKYSSMWFLLVIIQGSLHFP